MISKDFLNQYFSDDQLSFIFGATCWDLSSVDVVPDEDGYRVKFPYTILTSCELRTIMSYGLSFVVNHDSLVFILDLK